MSRTHSPGSLKVRVLVLNLLHTLYSLLLIFFSPYLSQKQGPDVCMYDICMYVCTSTAAVYLLLRALLLPYHQLYLLQHLLYGIVHVCQTQDGRKCTNCTQYRRQTFFSISYRTNNNSTVLQ